MNINVKICGITRWGDAQLSAEMGAGFLDYIFYPPSKRYVSPEKAAEIISAARFTHPEVKHVGVFVDADAETIADYHKIASFDFAQLHGEEPPALCDDLRTQGIGSIKTIGMGDDGPLLDFRKYEADYFLCDTHDAALKGGTGRTFDREKLPAGMPMDRLFLAGGITADNVGELVTAVRPFGIDVSSGVEETPGVKDKLKLTAFFEAVDMSRTKAE